MNVPVHQYCEFVGTIEKEGETRPFRQKHLIGKELKSGADYTSKKSAYEIFDEYRKTDPNKNFLGMRKQISEKEYGDYEFKTFSQVGKEVDNFLAGLIKLDMCPSIYVKEHEKNFKFLGIGSKNRTEWIVAALACMKGSITFVGLGTFPVIEYSLNQTEMTTILVESISLKQVLQLKKYKLKNIIILNSFNDSSIIKEVSDDYKKQNINLYCYEDILKIGEEYLKSLNGNLKLDEISLDTIALIIYSSGTTGNPKGIMHSNRSTLGIIPIEEIKLPKWNENDIYYSCCPLTHMLDNISFFQIYFFKVQVGFAVNILQFEKDLAYLNPTKITTVPRIGERAIEKLSQIVNSFPPFKKKLFYEAYKVKKYLYYKYGISKNWLFDKLIFDEIKYKLFGKNIQYVDFAGAHLNMKILEIFKLVFNVNVNNSYGLTEASIIVSTSPLDLDLKGIGGPLSNTELKLVDVPELGFTTKDKNAKTGILEPKGELCIRGTSVSEGYFKNKTPIVDKEGWFYSGDICLIDISKGNKLDIIDRKTNVFKLNMGEFVSISKIENILSASKYITQMSVAGKTDRNYLVAIICPNKEECLNFLLKNNIAATLENLPNFFNNELLKTEIVKDLDKIGRSNGLLGYELVKKIFIFNGIFSDIPGLTTQSLKVRSKKIYEFFKKEINEMYPQNYG